MKRKLRFRWKRWLGILSLVVLLLVAASLLLLHTGTGARWMRDLVVSQVEKMTGGKVELREFRFRPFSLRSELVDFTVRGREPEGTPPLFHADLLVVDVRVDSFFRRKIALDEVRIERPRVHVRFDAEGRSNVPAPRTPRAPSPKPQHQRLFDLAISRLRLNDGEVLYNNVRTPLVAEGGRMNFALDYHRAPTGAPAGDRYEGLFRWEQMILVAKRYLPFPNHILARFTLQRDAFELHEAQWKLPTSDFRFTASVRELAKPRWTARFDALLDLADLRTIMRKPNTPSGWVRFLGEMGNPNGRFEFRSSFDAQDITTRWKWFHASDISLDGHFHVEGQKIIVPDMRVRVVGGEIIGRLEFFFEGQRFRVDSRARGMSLKQVLAAMDHPSFPVARLHWNGSVDVESVTTWEKDFKRVESRGTSFWSRPLEPVEGEIPTSARLDFHWIMAQDRVDLRQSEISTPTSRMTMDGPLGARDSALLLNLEAQDLLPWNDFINRLRGEDAEPRRITGRARWQGRVLGRLGHPTFIGRLEALEAAYDRLYWDEVGGEITYSPDGFRLERGHARRGRSSAALDLWLELNDWGFRPENRWGFEANLERTPSDGLQDIFGTSYPARGLLTGQFRGRGTRADPELTGLVDLAEVEAWGFEFDRVRGQLAVRKDEIRVANAELRKGTGRITGNLLYRLPAGEVEFDVDGAVVPLESIRRIQTERLPLGGQLSFHVGGKGPLRAPTAEGNVRIVDLRVGEDVLGSFQGRLRADGRQVRLDLESAMETGRVEGRLDLVLGGDYPLTGDLTVQGIDLDAFIQAAFRLRPLTGHSRADGRLWFSGALARPETLAIETDVSRLEFNYQYLQLENVGPLRVTYRNEEVRVEQAHIRGPDTDFSISGYARFAGDRQLNLRLDGTVNLRLAGGFLPELEARGVAQVNAGIEGTLSSPRITGRVRLENVSANYGEIPTGLSQIRGDFVFDRSRLLFDNVTAEAGGGRLLLSGSVSYGNGPLRYDITARATRVRIRYPEGMSWLAGGQLRLSGSPASSLLSGRVTVERLLMAEGYDLPSQIILSRGGPRGPATTSEFLRNLQFDIEAASTPDARMEWSGGRLETEADIRARGTWEHPLFVGHIHLLGGEMTFRGNRYRLARGDINFQPFGPPQIDVEAVTTIRQYEVTVNFTGRSDQLRLSYRSDPPLPSSDVIALLSVGRTGEESELRRATQEQAPELGAGRLLGEALSSEVTGRIGRLFGISRFRVDPFLAGSGSEQNATARVTIEQQLTRDLVITYITNVTGAQQQVIQVEYNINRDLSVVALRDQNGTFGLDIKFKKRFR